MDKGRVTTAVLGISLALNVVTLAAGGYLVYRKAEARAALRTRTDRGAGEAARLAEWYASSPAIQADVVFAGDSITVGLVDDTLNHFLEGDLAEPWASLVEGRRLKGRGIGYDTSDKLLARLDGITRLRPRKLFLMIGINDLTSGKTPEQVEANVHEILRRVRQDSPQTQVFVQSVLPVNEHQFFRGGNSLVRQTNDRLRALCQETRVTYIDLHPLFADGGGQLRGEFADDGLHPHGRAHDAWREALAQYLGQPTPAR
jgi:lysophospholipase L1-like esterase